MRIRLALGLDSVLLDRSDRALVAMDRIIQSWLARGHPDRWTPPDEAVLGDSKEARFLLDLYRSIFMAHHGESSGSLILSQRTYQESQVPQIRARAAQFRCQGLLANNLDRRHDGELEAADRSEKECRALCERALLEFVGFSWSGVVSHQFHAALGILDYYAGNRLAAKFHLARGLEQYSRTRTRYEKHSWVVALVYYYSGVLANEVNEIQDAVRYLTVAVRTVPPLMRVGALVQLSSALLKAGDPRGARKVARRGLKSALLQESRKGIASELKAWIAVADVELGNQREAMRLFQEVIEAGDSPGWSDKAREWLRHLNRTR